ncbi:MAG: DUF1326 domain-containing protein [Actinomycetota bacterium]
MSWKIRAKYYEACNCELGCPCNMSGFPSHGFCEGAIAFEVISGERDGVDLTGVKVAEAVKWPGAIHEGNGVAAVWVDASPEQIEALVPILTAEDPGLPFEILAATVSEIKGPFTETVEIKDNDTDSSVRVGDVFDLQLQTFMDPVSGEPHEAHMVLPTGFIFTDAKICTTSTNKVSVDGFGFDHAGKNGYYSEVEWSSENRMAPVVG